MATLLFLVSVDVDEDIPVDQQLNQEWIRDEEDKLFFRDIEGKRFRELNTVQKKAVAEWLFKDTVGEGVAGDAYSYELLGETL